MEALWMESSPRYPMEPKWGRMLFISFLLHLGAFSLIFVVPEQIPTRRIKGDVYEVSLVEMPRPRAGTAKATVRPQTMKGTVSVKKAAPAQRISAPKEKEKPVVIAKTTLEKKKTVTEKPRESPNKLIDKALSKIEKKVERETVKEPEKAKPEPEDEGHLDQAIAKLEAQKTETGDTSHVGEGPPSGIPIQIYKSLVEDLIKDNWSYPTAGISPDKVPALEAIVILTVKREGTIVKSWFEKRSSNALFDRSVSRAIERTEVLPPFPPGYHKTSEELVITFNLKELMEK